MLHYKRVKQTKLKGDIKKIKKKYFKVSREEKC